MEGELSDSDLFSDDSDRDLDFSLQMYAKKRKWDLSDEEKEALGPKRKNCVPLTESKAYHFSMG